MAFTLDFSLALGAGKAGLSDLRAQLVDTAGSNVGSAVSTGFTEIGQGYYLWHYASFPDSHRGGVKFYSNASPSTYLAFAAVNPEEAENTDAKTSTRSTYAGGDTAGTTTLLSRVTGPVVLAGSAPSWYTAPLDAAATRSALGLGVANLDTQLFSIYGEAALAYSGTQTLLTREDVSGSVAAIKAKTDNLPASPASTSDVPTVSQIWATVLAESYAADGAAFTGAQALYEICQALTDFGVSGTTLTVRKRDGSTTAATYTLDDASNPTSRTRSS